MIHEHQPCYHVWLFSASDKLVRHADCHKTRQSAWDKLNRLRITLVVDGRVMASEDKRTMKSEVESA